MASISAISPTGSSATDTDTSSVSRIPQKQLGQNDFLKLLAAQFKAQDPMKPMEDTAFIAQMAQFSALEQSTAMASSLTAIRADQNLATANSYLGHQVTVNNGDGTVATGLVSGIEINGGTPRLVIGEFSYPISAVVLVEPAALSAPAPQPVSTGGA